MIRMHEYSAVRTAGRRRTCDMNVVGRGRFASFSNSRSFGSRKLDEAINYGRKWEWAILDSHRCSLTYKSSLIARGSTVQRWE